MGFEIDPGDFQVPEKKETEKTMLKTLEDIVNEELEVSVSEHGTLKPFVVEHDGYKATFDGTRIELVDGQGGERAIDISGNGSEEQEFEDFMRMVKREVRSRTEGMETIV